MNFLRAISFSLLFFFCQISFGDFIDRSHSIFFSSKVQQEIGDYQGFPAFWWNFLVFEVQNENQWKRAEEACENLKKLNLVSKVQCRENLGDFLPIIEAWAKDLPLRMPMPSEEAFRAKLNSSLAQAGVAMGEANLLKILRIDPFESWRELKAHADSKIKIKFKRVRGFFFDSNTSRIIIPVQMAFSPSEMLKTKEVKNLLGDGWYLIGPHGSNYSNETQVRKDVKRVSEVGTILLLIFATVLLLLKRSRVLLLVPAVGLAMVASTFVTILFYGSVHGLVLSFGTGIVGLALDYGLQAVFNGRSPHLWKSNFFGLLTTLVGLAIMGLSSMPLLRQMMLFSFVGLTVAFGFFYFLFKLNPKLFIVEPLRLQPRLNIGKTLVALVLVLASTASFSILKPTLDLTRLDFQDEKTREVMIWLFMELQMRPPIFAVTSDNPLTKATQEQNWAEQNQVEVENLGSYLPPTAKQSENLKSWTGFDSKNFSLTQKKFFKPFFDNFLNFKEFDEKRPPIYIDHLTTEKRWLTLWLPKDDKQESEIRKQFTNVVSAKEIVSEIPITLSRELQWMAPLSIILAALLLLFYYRKFSLVVSSLLPFFSGMGLVTLCSYVLKFDISFVTIIALVMVFGFSIDYGVFATDLHRGLKDQSNTGVWTGLTLAVLTTAAGFVPLLFCQHPLLKGLGQTLFCGTLGTYVGAIWGIPAYSKLLKTAS